MVVWGNVCWVSEASGSWFRLGLPAANEALLRHGVSLLPINTKL
jgi:hypothetical protein